MSADRSKFEAARRNVPNAWTKIVSLIDRSPRFGFKPLAVCLLVVKITDDQHYHKIICTPLESDIAKRLEQIQNAFTETVGEETIPVGVLFVGKTTDGTRGLDDIVLVPDAVAAAAEIVNSDVEAVIDGLSDGGAALASRMLLGPNGGYDAITEIR